MERYLFIPSVLRFLSHGPRFRSAFTLGLQVAGVVLALAGAVAWFLLWRGVFALPDSGLVGGIVFQLVFAVGIYMVVHLFLARSGAVASLPLGDYPLLPLFSLLLRLLGEGYAAWTFALSLGGGIFVWFAGSKAFPLLPPMLLPFALKDPSFLGGLYLLVGGTLSAALGLVLAYVLAEVAALFLEMGMNSRKK